MATAKVTDSAIELREIDRLVVVGQSQSQTVYEIMGMKGRLTPPQRQMRTHYAEGLKAHRAQRWDEARTAFAAALEAVPDDGPTLALTGRITDFKTNLPPENWDGAWHLDHK